MNVEKAIRLKNDQNSTMELNANKEKRFVEDTFPELKNLTAQLKRAGREYANYSNTPIISQNSAKLSSLGRAVIKANNELNDFKESHNILEDTSMLVDLVSLKAIMISNDKKINDLKNDLNKKKGFFTNIIEKLSNKTNKIKSKLEQLETQNKTIKDVNKEVFSNLDKKSSLTQVLNDDKKKERLFIKNNEKMKNIEPVKTQARGL